jgi:hypothetical protein
MTIIAVAGCGQEAKQVTDTDRYISAYSMGNKSFVLFIAFYTEYYEAMLRQN